MNALIHNIKSKYVGRFICVYIIRLFPLPEDFLRVDHYVPVDTDSVIHNMRLLLMFSCKWCTISE